MNQALCLKATIRLCTRGGDRCFGPGIAALPEQVRQCRSLRAAAASMACSKVWKIVRTAEDAFGCTPLNSTTDGKPGGAVLTAQAEGLLAAYRVYAARVEQVSRRRFRGAFAFCWDAGTDKEAE